MISAFGNNGWSFDSFKDSGIFFADSPLIFFLFKNADNTRSAWEGTWRISVERFHSQKSPSASFGTPLPSHPGFFLCLF